MPQIEAFVKAVWKRLLYFIPLPYRLEGKNWFLLFPDEMGFSILARCYHDVNATNFYLNFIKEGMIVFDIGANQGYYSVLAAGLVGKSGKVYSFEPVASVLHKLKLNIFVNRLKNIRIENLALGDNLGFSTLTVFRDGFESCSSFRPSFNDIKARSKVARVLVTSLDNYAQNNNISQVDFMKIDAEGAEFSILRGGQDLVISKFRPVIMCEVADVRTRPWGYNANEIYKFLEQKGYSWFEISSNGTLLFSEIKEQYEPKWYNLIAVPKERISRLTEIIERN